MLRAEISPWQSCVREFEKHDKGKSQQATTQGSPTHHVVVSRDVPRRKLCEVSFIKHLESMGQGGRGEMPGGQG
jgi:hypothetical protein